ncbi:MAG: very short patch repair endonuclease [Deltaproteobacteria bacterium HGW-Deltaproteobacteria-15]|jgi:DNA mismatch endonuclease (patch repair protein)|nr:MAG: very short patch repair endonuclease [Deltaproteobacteria bacterium HGW-Deltaproteobacteria-15]
MVDRVDKQTRHRIMRANRGKNTGPEVSVRKAFYSKGFRYRLHDRNLPGRPDMVFKPQKAVVFVHGCFWHGHSCRRKPHAKSNCSYWQQKIEANKRRDLETRNELLQKNWRILVIWECAVRRRKPPFAESADIELAVSWLLGSGRLAILSEKGFDECL